MSATTLLSQSQENIIRNASVEEVQEYIEKSLSQNLDKTQKETLVTIVYFASRRLDDKNLYALVEHLENYKETKSNVTQDIIFDLISKNATAEEVSSIMAFIYAKLDNTMSAVRIFDKLSEYDKEQEDAIKPVALRMIQKISVKTPLEIINYFDTEWQIRALNHVAYSDIASTEIITAIGRIVIFLKEDSSLRFFNGALRKMLDKRPDKIEEIFKIIESFITQSCFFDQENPNKSISEDAKTIIRFGVEVLNQSNKPQSKAYCLIDKVMQCKWGESDWQILEEFIETTTKLDVLECIRSPLNNKKIVEFFVEKWRENNPNPTSEEEKSFKELLERYELQ